MFLFREYIHPTLADLSGKDVPAEALVDNWRVANIIPFINNFRQHPFFVEFGVASTEWVDENTPHHYLVAKTSISSFVVASILATGESIISDLGLPTMDMPPLTESEQFEERDEAEFRVFEHRPGWADSDEPLAEAKVSNRAELFCVPFIAGRIDEKLERFSLSHREGEMSASLMAEYKDGSYWVIARIEAKRETYFKNLKMPKWEAPKPLFDFIEIDPAVPPAHRKKFQFRTRDQLLTDSFIKHWGEKPDFLRYSLEVVEGMPDAWDLIAESSRLNMIIGRISVSNDVGQLSPIASLNMPFFRKNKIDAERVAELSDIPGVSVTDRSSIQSEVPREGLLSEAEEIYQNYLSDRHPHQAFVDMVLEHSDPGSDFAELREVAMRACKEGNGVAVTAGGKKRISIDIDPDDKDPLGTVIYKLSEAGFVYAATDNVVGREFVDTSEGIVEVNGEVSEEKREELLMNFQNVFMSPETSWDDLINAATAAKEAGCFTPGQFIEADGSDILDEALKQEDALLKKSILTPHQQSEVDRIKEGLAAGRYGARGQIEGVQRIEDSVLHYNPTNHGKKE